MYHYDRTASRQLQLGPEKPEPSLTAQLQKIKLKANRSAWDLSSVVIQAGFYAQKLNKPMYVYQGNSNMHLVYRATYKTSEALDPINNTGGAVYVVTPELVVTRQEIVGR